MHPILGDRSLAFSWQARATRRSRRQARRCALNGTELLEPREVPAIVVGNPPAPAPDPLTGGVEADRMARLARGVNLTDWFRFADEPLDQWFATKVTDAELSNIRDQGFRHVRLPLMPQYIFNPNNPGTPNPMTLGYIDDAVERLLAHDLAVVIDFHVEDEEFFDAPGMVAKVNAFWQTMAGHFSVYDPDMVFLEVANEPVFMDHEQDWQPIQAQLLATMRAAAPEHTLIGAAPHWANIDFIDYITPVADPNVLYTVHIYDPFQFTHQGAWWTGPEIEMVKGLPYPSTPQNVASLANQLQSQLRNQPDLAWIPDYVRQYGADRWNAAKIQARVDVAADWAREHGVQLYVGEFGVYREGGVRPADRAAWLRDVRVALERHGIGWAVWAYDDNFGIASRTGPAISVGGTATPTGIPKFDATYTAALGLPKPVVNPVHVVPAAQTAKEDVVLYFGSNTKNAIQVADPGKSNLPVQVTLTATNGVMSLSGIKGLTFVAGDGKLDATMTFRGSLASVNAALQKMGFVPAANYSGAAQLTIRSELVGSTGIGMLGQAARDVDTIAINVLAVNDAPTFATGGVINLAALNGNTGVSVADLLGGRDRDVDPAARRGVAITASAAGKLDRWEYSTDGGATWKAIGTLSEKSALLLRDTDRVRLIAPPGAAHIASLAFRAWDQTRGIAGQKVDAKSWGFGGAGPFSATNAGASVSLFGAPPVGGGSSGGGITVG